MVHWSASGSILRVRECIRVVFDISKESNQVTANAGKCMQMTGALRVESRAAAEKSFQVRSVI